MRNELEKDALNPAKCDDLDYIHFLIASMTMDVFSCTEAARCQVARASQAHMSTLLMQEGWKPDIIAKLVDYAS